jgi:DNA repair exonuclease SbcCD ATPase subunit
MSEDIDWNDLNAKAAAGKEAKVIAQNVVDLLQELRSAEKDRDLARTEINKMKDDFNLQSIQLEKLGDDLRKAQKATTPLGELTEWKNKVATLEADTKGKAQFIAQLEKESMDAKNKLAELQTKAAGSAGADARVKELEAKLSAKDKEIADMAGKLQAVESIKADFEKMKAEGASGPSAAAQDFQKEKEEFESEKKKLFAEMENFEVGLRMEMEQKDEKLKALDDQIKDLKEHPAVSPSAVMAATTAPVHHTKESLIAKLGLEKVDMARTPVPAGKDYAYPGVGGKAEVITPASSESRIICPKCSSTSVRAESDRSRVLSYMGGVPMYAKKYVCRKCMYDFRVD